MQAQRLFVLAALLAGLSWPPGVPTLSAQADSILMVNTPADHSTGRAIRMCWALLTVRCGMR